MTVAVHTASVRMLAGGADCRMSNDQRRRDE